MKVPIFLKKKILLQLIIFSLIINFKKDKIKDIKTLKESGKMI